MKPPTTAPAAVEPPNTHDPALGPVHRAPYVGYDNPAMCIDNQKTTADCHLVKGPLDR